jgi:deoxyadenosine/deoxycytidine kinase
MSQVSKKKIYSLSGIPGVGKTTRGRELERRYGWKFYPEPTHEWPLDEFYSVKRAFEEGNATKEDMMDATNYLQLRIGISYLRLGVEINRFMEEHPDVRVVVERSPFDTTLFLRANTIPDDLRPMQINQYEALKDFMSMYNHIDPWNNVHHIFFVCDIDVTISRLESRNETRISRPYLQQLHDIHVRAFPALEDRRSDDVADLKTSAYVGERSLYHVIDVSYNDAIRTCELMMQLLDDQ